MAVDWLVMFAIALAMQVVAYLITPKPKGPKPEAAQQAESPTADAGKPMGVLFGTARLSETNIIGYWDKSTRQYKVKV